MMNVLAVSPTKPIRNSKFSDEQLMDLHSQGLSIRKVAKRLGVSDWPVRERMKELGLKANGKPGGVPRYEKVGSEDFRCSSCGRVKPLRQRHGTICCGCHHARWVGTREGALRFRFNMKKSCARRRGIPFTLTFEDFKGLYEQQAGRDGYTGEQMSFDFGQGRSRKTASLDRIDNNGGYTPGNVMFCRLATNGKKQDLPVHQFVEQLKFDFPSQVSDASQPES